MDATGEVKALMFDAIGDEDDVHALVRNLDAAGYAIVPKVMGDKALWHASQAGASFDSGSIGEMAAEIHAAIEFARIKP